MERLFQISAVILAGVAAYFLWNGNSESAFVTAVFGAVSFFLSLRFQVKERFNEREIEREREEELGRKGEEEILESENLLGDISADEQFKEQRTTDNERLTR